MTRVMSEQRFRHPEEPGRGGNGQAPFPDSTRAETGKAGAAPDYFPGKPGGNLTLWRRVARFRRLRRPRRQWVSWLQAH